MWHEAACRQDAAEAAEATTTRSQLELPTLPAPLVLILTLLSRQCPPPPLPYLLPLPCTRVYPAYPYCLSANKSVINAFYDFNEFSVYIRPRGDSSRRKGARGKEEGKGKRSELDLATRNALENADILSSCQHDNKN